MRKIKDLEPEDTLQLVIEATDKEEKAFFRISKKYAKSKYR